MYNSNGLFDRRFDSCLSNVIKFYSFGSNENFKIKNFDALGGQVKGLVIFRDNENLRFYRNHDSNNILLLDGTPFFEDSILDAKTLYYLYSNYGISNVASKIDGSHVEVFINEEKGSVHIVRDRVGLKPIYHSFENGIFICSSNIGAILKSGLVTPNYHSKTIAKYAVCNYKSNYGTKETFFNNIDLVLPSTEVTFSDQKIQIREYFKWDSKKEYLNSKSVELKNYFIETIKSSISKYYSLLEKNKSIVALSGGIDSGTIVGMLHKIIGEKVHGISLSYNENTDFDESKLIQCSVRDHVKSWINLKLNPHLLADDLSNLYNNFDTPFATVSIYGYHYLFKECAKLGYQNIFTGAGGDLLQFGNYPCFLYYFADLKKEDNDLFKSEIKYWIKNHSTPKFPKSIKTVNDFFENNIDFAIQGALKKTENFLPSGNILNKEYYNSIKNVNSSVVEPYESYSRTYFVQELMYDNVAPGIQAEDLIDWIHGTTMVSPFFSNKLLELGWVLPPDGKIKNGVNKVMSRKYLRGICSEEVLDNIDKSGFNAPFDIWLRTNLYEFSMDTFYSKSFQERNIYDLKKFYQILQNHMDYKENHMMLLWQALNLELWALKWLKR